MQFRINGAVLVLVSAYLGILLEFVIAKRFYLRNVCHD